SGAVQRHGVHRHGPVHRRRILAPHPTPERERVYLAEPFAGKHVPDHLFAAGVQGTEGVVVLPVAVEVAVGQETPAGGGEVGVAAGGEVDGQVVRLRDGADAVARPRALSPVQREGGQYLGGARGARLGDQRPRIPGWGRVQEHV